MSDAAAKPPVTDEVREAEWRSYADSIDVDYTATYVQDDFNAGWRAALRAVAGANE